MFCTLPNKQAKCHSVVLQFLTSLNTFFVGFSIGPQHNISLAQHFLPRPTNDAFSGHPIHPYPPVHCYEDPQVAESSFHTFILDMSVGVLQSWCFEADCSKFNSGPRIEKTFITTFIFINIMCNVGNS